MDAIKLFVQYQAKLAEALTGTKVYVSGGSSDKEVRKNGMKTNDELLILSKALHATLQNQNNELTQSKARIRDLQQWVNDLHTGMYVNCVYCGHRYGPDKDTPVAMADILKEHIEQCPEHPLSKATARIRELEGQLKAIMSKGCLCNKCLDKALSEKSDKEK